MLQRTVTKGQLFNPYFDSCMSLIIHSQAEWGSVTIFDSSVAYCICTLYVCANPNMVYSLGVA